MIDLYVTLIINQRRAFNTIPIQLQNVVKNKLEELGYDTNGNRLVSDE